MDTVNIYPVSKNGESGMSWGICPGRKCPDTQSRIAMMVKLTKLLKLSQSATAPDYGLYM